MPGIQITGIEEQGCVFMCVHKRGLLRSGGSKCTFRKSLAVQREGYVHRAVAEMGKRRLF